jgi:hypothetical protein
LLLVEPLYTKQKKAVNIKNKQKKKQLTSRFIPLKNRVFCYNRKKKKMWRFRNCDVLVDPSAFHVIGGGKLDVARALFGAKVPHRLRRKRRTINERTNERNNALRVRSHLDVVVLGERFAQRIAIACRSDNECSATNNLAELNTLLPVTMFTTPPGKSDVSST